MSSLHGLYALRLKVTTFSSNNFENIVGGFKNLQRE